MLLLLIGYQAREQARGFYVSSPRLGKVGKTPGALSRDDGGFLGLDEAKRGGAEGAEERRGLNRKGAKVAKGRKGTQRDAKGRKAGTMGSFWGWMKTIEF